MIAGILIIFTSPLLAITDEYAELEKRLNTGDFPDTGFVSSLPSPDESREYWLRSRVRNSYERALSDLRTAINQSESDSDRIQYLISWAKLKLLNEPSTADLEFIKERLETVDQYASEHGQLWLYASRMAISRARYSLATEWALTASTDSEFHSEAMLDRAEIKLKTGDLASAEQILDSFFMKYSNSSRPRYWLLRGRVFENSNSDSEAYLAYSHLINNYPESMKLAEAERRIDSLPLPDEFTPNTSAQKTQSPSTDSKSSNRISIKPPETEQKTRDKIDRFRVQVGSFQDSASAETLKSRLRTHVKQRVIVQNANVRGTQYYRVHVKGFANKTDARKVLRNLQKKGFEGYLTAGDDQ